MIIKNHGVIVIEDLKVAAMTASGKGTVEIPGKNLQRQANLNRSLFEVSPRMIRTMLQYKAMVRFQDHRRRFGQNLTTVQCL